MKIIRDGKEFELTREEVRMIYTEEEIRYRKEDIIQRVEEMEYAIQNINDCITELNWYVENELEHNDYYWQEYWHTIDHAIEAYMEDNQL